MKKLKQKALEQLFLAARTHNAWLDKPVSIKKLKKLYALMKMAPTSANCSPARLVFVCSDEGKEKLKPCLMEGNIEKTMQAPVCVIIGYDLDFYEHLPSLFPHTDAKSWFEGRPKHIENTAKLNSSLQGAYLLMAARSLGLDCGPMSGFNKKKTDETFFANTQIKANFIMNIGYGDATGLFARSPRFEFEDVCQIV